MSLLRIGSRALSSGKIQTAAASAVAAKPSPGPPVKFSQGENGLHLVSMDIPLPVVTLGVMVNAGTRHEPYEDAGVSQAVRLMAGSSTENFTSFGITRGLQQLGGRLSCRQGREHTLYTLQVNRDHINEAVDFLMESVHCPSYKPWEVMDTLGPSMRVEEAQFSCPELICSEGVHRAAYRTGLGNGLYCPERNVGKLGPKALNAFHQNHYTSERTAVVGLGLDSIQVAKLANFLPLKAGKGPAATKSKFAGDEFRREMYSPNTYVSIVAEATGFNDTPTAFADLVLLYILGRGSGTKRGTGTGKLQLAVSSAVGAVPHSVSGLNYKYSDSAIIGAELIVDKASAGKAIDAVVSTLKGLKVTDEDVIAAKKKLTVGLDDDLRQDAMVENLGLQAVFLGGMQDMTSLINSVSTADVQTSAKKLSGKLSMSASGNLANVPYLDSIQ